MKRTTKTLGAVGALLLAATLVSATLLTYFGSVQTTMNVQQSVVVDGNNWDHPILQTIDATGGCDYCYQHNITNRGCKGIWLDFTTLVTPPDGGDGQGLTTTYNAYSNVPCVYKCFNLPPVCVDVCFGYPGTTSYFDTVLSNVPGGYSVGDGTYTGWCADEDHTVSPGTTYQGHLYIACDPANPYPSANWSKVCWLINNKPENMTGAQIQSAIWKFINHGYDGSDPAVWWLIGVASTHSDFVPSPGQLACCVVWIPGHQTTFIELTVPQCTPTCCGSPLDLPIFLGPGQTLHFCICYQLDMLIAPGIYTVASNLVPSEAQD